MSENFVDCFFYVCMYVVCVVVVVWIKVRLVSNYIFLFCFFFVILDFFLVHLVQGVVWLRVWLVLEFLGQHNLAGFVPQVQSVPGWVSAINVPHPVQMVIPCLLGLGQSAHAWCPDVARIVVVVDWPRRVPVRLPVHRLVVVAQRLDAVGRRVDLVQQQDRSVPPGRRIVCADIIGSFQWSDVWLPESGLLVWRLIHANHR